MIPFRPLALSYGMFGRELRHEIAYSGHDQFARQGDNDDPVWSDGSHWQCVHGTSGGAPCPADVAATAKRARSP